MVQGGYGKRNDKSGHRTVDPVVAGSSPVVLD